MELYIVCTALVAPSRQGSDYKLMSYLRDDRILQRLYSARSMVQTLGNSRTVCVCEELAGAYRVHG